jgi:hypothetical protein
MNTRFLLATLAAAAAFSGAARADDADASQYVIQFEGQRTRAEVMAEAARVSATRNLEPAGSRVAELPRSTLDIQALRAETIQALRAGKIPSGEANF